MSGFFYYLAAFALVLGILVIFHEFGHYLAARWAGVNTRFVTACSIDTSKGRTDSLYQPSRMASTPLPHVVTLLWWTNTGGTSNQRQSSSTLNMRVSSSC